MSEKELKAVRVKEYHTEAGPVIYIVEVMWWPGKGWETHATKATWEQANRVMNTLLEGLDDSNAGKTRVVRSWTQNGFYPSGFEE